MSVHAVVLIQCEIDGIPEAAQAIADIDGVSEVYSVAGEFDLVAIVRVSQHDDLATVIPGGIAKVDGVDRTETLIAFQVYSQARPRAAVLDRVRGRLVCVRPARRAPTRRRSGSDVRPHSSSSPE